MLTHPLQVMLNYLSTLAYPSTSGNAYSFASGNAYPSTPGNVYPFIREYELIHLENLDFVIYALYHSKTETYLV